MMKQLYNKALDIYFQLKPHQTNDWERYWANRKFGKDWHGQQKNWIDGYWNSRHHLHRKLLVDTIVKYEPKTVLEIGCASAPNLALLTERLPQTKLVGMDINEHALNRARYEFALNPNVTLHYGKADQMGFADKYFDVTFTDAMMIYIGKDKITQVMENIKRTTKKAVIFLERHMIGVGWEGYYKDGLWYRDYLRLAKVFFPNSIVSITKITENIWKEWSEYGYLIEVKI